MTKSEDGAQPVYLGVDVSKEHLDVSFEQPGAQRVRRTKGAWTAWLMKQRKKYDDLHVVMEATGGFEQLVVEVCHELGVRCSVVNPLRARQFAKSCGYLAKTDSVDARMLAAFGRAWPPRVSEPVSEEQRELRSLVERRRELLKLRSAEKNRLGAVGTLKESIQSHIDWLDDETASFDEQIDAAISASKRMAEKASRMRAVKGVGPVLVAVLLALLPELGQLNRREVAAIVGVAPFAHDSGKRRGQRHIFGGRAELRSVLYMAAMVAARCNPELKIFAERLRAKGKPVKVVFTAVARKLLIGLNAMMRDDAAWDASMMLAR